MYRRPGKTGTGQDGHTNAQEQDPNWSSSKFIPGKEDTHSRLSAVHLWAAQVRDLGLLRT